MGSDKRVDVLRGGIQAQLIKQGFKGWYWRIHIVLHAGFGGVCIGGLSRSRVLSDSQEVNAPESTAVLRALAASFAATAAASAVLNQRSFSTWCICDRGQGGLGTHYDNCLEFSVYFLGFAMDKKFANIKFRHV